MDLTHMQEAVSNALKFLEEPVQYVALAWMATLYAIKISKLLKKPFPPEKAEFKGDRTKGALLSLTNVLRPWDMESTSKNLFFYTEFMVFHIAVALTIGSTFFIPLFPQIMVPAVTNIIMLFMGLAFLIGVRRIIRRLTAPEIKIITTIDDMFAICLMTAFFAVGFITMWNWTHGSAENIWMWIFFVMTTFFLIYVPFSKISHYVLYPFGRVNFGMIFGGRGVINKEKQHANWDPRI